MKYHPHNFTNDVINADVVYNHLSMTMNWYCQPKPRSHLIYIIIITIFAKT